MSRLGIVIVVFLLLGAVGVIAIKRGGAEEEREKAAAKASPGATAGKSRRADREAEPALVRLRRVLDLPVADAPTFEELDRVARRLSDAELARLIAEVGFGSEKGLEGWVRSVLYAEWGRRDPEGALASVAEAEDKNAARWAVEQAYFGVYRGWTEKDAGAALASLLESEREAADTEGKRRTRYWTGYAHKQIFKEYARQDAEAAWKAIPEGSARDDATIGLFRGMASESQLREFVDRWLERWNSPESLKAHETYEDLVNNFRTTGVVMVPPDETIARSAALALAAFDFPSAKEWLQKTGPGDEKMRTNRYAELLRTWAMVFPDKAQEFLGNQDYHQETLGRGIIQGDPSRAVEVMERMDNAGVRARTMQVAVNGLGNHHVRDYFPAPGERNRLPDFEEQYEHILQAVDAGNFSGGQKNSLLRSVHRSFQHQVPAAKEAFGN